MMSKTIDSAFIRKIAVFVFLVLTGWWVYVAVILGNEDISSNLLWGASYQLMALFGGVCGLIISRSWGGFKSALGRMMGFFSIGLLLQVFGQSVFSYYNLILEVEIPYPSLADLGYFLSIPFYIYAAILLGKVSGARMSMQSVHKKIQVILIPLLLLILSYLVFLKGYDFDMSAPIRVLLDFGYPLGQAIYVSLALLVFLLTKDFLGGMMRPKVLTILFALVVQYIADYNFLYQVQHETWVNGGYGDFIYLLSYFLMALALINVGSVFERIKETN